MDVRVARMAKPPSVSEGQRLGRVDGDWDQVVGNGAEGGASGRLATTTSALPDQTHELVVGNRGGEALAEGGPAPKELAPGGSTDPTLVLPLEHQADDFLGGLGLFWKGSYHHGGHQALPTMIGTTVGGMPTSNLGPKVFTANHLGLAFHEDSPRVRRPWWNM